MKTPTNQWSSVTIAVDTPNGKMYVTILDDPDGNPIEIIISAGKNGSAVLAWAAGLASVMTSALQRGTGINELITDLSSQASDNPRRRSSDGVGVRSGPEGVCYALIQYRKMKYRELRDKLNAHVDDEDDDPKGRRPARMGR